MLHTGCGLKYMVEDLNQIPVKNPAVVSRLVNDEAVLVIPSLGKVKVLNGIGARIWTLIDGNRSIGLILDIINHEYSVSDEDARKDLINFLEQLFDRQLITLSR